MLLANGNFDSETSWAIFIGGTDKDLEASWTWLDNTPWEYSNWPADEPNGGAEENCLEMVGFAEPDKGKPDPGWWNDIPCGRNSTQHFVCAYDNGGWLDVSPTILTLIYVFLIENLF